MMGRYAVPGVYTRARNRAAGFPRVRTDVVGMVGAAGPRHVGQAKVVEDWKSYVATFREDDTGRSIATTPGSTLEPAVRDFFANGGRRLWIVNVAWDPMGEPNVFLNEMLGLGDNREPHGLELLLRQDDVSVVMVPDLDLTRITDDDRYDVPPMTAHPCFGPCGTRGAHPPPAVPKDKIADKIGGKIAQRVFSNDDVLWAQRYLLGRLDCTAWRWFAVLTPPPGLSIDAAIDWRERLGKGNDGAEHGALYWPWVLVQDSPGAPVTVRSPLGAVAGIVAATDLSDGPHVAPANRPVLGAVAPETPISDADNGRAYDAGINVLRDFAGRGIVLWGARTLRWRSRRDRGDVMAYISPRRCLSAIARTAEFISRPTVFDPNTAILRIRLHQIMTDYLLRVFSSGALKGEVAEEGFFVSIEPVNHGAPGQIITRIGVALATPAEFIEVRIGRENGVIENAEAFA